MSYEDRIKELERTRSEIIRFTNELDEKLRIKEMDGIEYHVVLNEKLGGKSKEELINYIDQKLLLEKKKLQDRNQNKKRKTTITISAAAIVLIIMAIIGIIYTNPEALTGYTTATKEIQEIIEYGRVFEHNTETQLNITNITSLKISGELTGTGAKIKLRINDIEYLVADVNKPAEEQSLITGLAIGEEPAPEYILTTDKTEYALGEIIYTSVTPEAENKSVYVAYEEETHRLEDNTYLASQPGEHQAIALIVLPDDILRLETNFTVINVTVNASTNKSINVTENESINKTINQTINETSNATGNATINETTNISEEGYVFANVCVDTCNLIETSYPILLVELEEDSSLTITEITVVQSKENSAPTQIKTIPDISITTSQTAILNLDNYFSDPDEDLVVYDINEITEINTPIEQETLTINSKTPGIYTAYIYATDGDKLVTSNTFQITIIETNATINQTINITPTTNITTNETNTTTPANETITPPTKTYTLIDPCVHPNPNMRPLECIEGTEEKYFVLESVFLSNPKRGNAARITPLGNMIITGQLFENSTMSPGTNDFRVTERNTDYEYVPVAWIDSDTGNLYIIGQLYEEDFFLSPTRNAFVVQNKRNVNLAYIDRRTGDLHLKGNLIQQRDKLE
ncbi:hypothetical protein KY348_04320 [Candidatus Woesearchaeota archaeon]|nr:hypothetical protein [Candidatus Woesearchaeota archaeon]